MKSLYHDATNSWNGYAYQGKAAIYTILKMINDLGLGIDTAMEYELELEYLEDFTVYFQKKELSVHQVKTYNSTAPSEYKDAIWTLLGKTAMRSSIVKAYLHTTEELPGKTILKEKYKNLVAPLPTGSETQLNPFDYYNFVVENEAYDSSFEKLELYSYENGQNYCGLIEIREAISSQIKRYYYDRGIFRTDEHQSRVFYYLLAKLDQHISERHLALQKGNVTRAGRMISFSDFFAILDNDFEQVSSQYYIYILRELYSTVCEEFLYDQQSEMGSDSYGRVQSFYNEVRLLDDITFLKLCKKWTPHVRANVLNLKTFHGLIPSNGLRDPLLKALYVFTEPLHNDKSVYIKKDNSGVNITYLPTTLHERPTLLTDDQMLDEKRIGRIAKEIIMNSDVEDLHEVDVMISSHIPMLSLEDAANKHTKVSSTDFDNYSDDNKFMKIKNIRMIPFTEAREEFEI